MTKAREIAELGQKLTVDASGNLGFAGDLELGDNNKAIFGAGSDLQIYHDGDHSYIADEGTGELRLEASSLIRMMGNNGETLAVFNEDGAVSLRYDGSAKLATTSTGVDITGTLTSDGLTVASASSGVNTTLGSNAVGLDFSVGHTGNGTGTINLYPKSSPSTQSDSLSLQLGGSTFFKMEDGGDISFYENTGTTAKFFWDASAESLGIGAGDVNLSGVGTNSQNVVTTIQGNNQFRGILELANSTGVSSVDGSAGDVAWFDNDNKIAQISALGQDLTNHDDGDLAFSTASAGTVTERMRITSSGSVGIGTTSPNTALSLSGGQISGVSSIYRGTTATTQAGIALETDGTHKFMYGAAEQMRIDGSGNLIVGETSTSSVTNGAAVYIASNGQLYASSTSSHFFNRKSTDGDIITFRKDGSTVGSIGNVGNNVYYSGGSPLNYSTGLLMKGASASNTRVIVPSDDTGTELDTKVSLGRDVSRFKDLYLSGGVYLGGTGSANKLDDYEEGTWTPTIVGSSSQSGQVYNKQQGTYTKIGNRCFCSFNLRLTTEGTFTGTYLLLSGLPFNIPSSGHDTVHGGSLYFVGLGVSVYMAGLQLKENDNKAYLWAKISHSVSREYLSNTDLTNTTELTGQFNYPVA